MGIFSSKIEVKELEEMELNLVELNFRLTEEECKIFCRLKLHLYNVLAVYRKYIADEKIKKYLSEEKHAAMIVLIETTESKLHHTPSYDEQLDLIYTFGESANEMKTRLFNIEQFLSTSEITEDQFAIFLKIALACACNLSGASIINSNDEKRISVIILKLFLKSPTSKISTLLGTNTNHLDAISQSFHHFSSTDTHALNFEEIRNQLEVIKSRLDNISSDIADRINEIDEDRAKETSDASTVDLAQYASLHNSRYLTRLYFDLQDYSAVVDTLLPPINQEAMTTAKKRINSAGDIVLNLTDNNRDQIPGFQRLQNLSINILHRFNRIDKVNRNVIGILKFLKEINDQLPLLESQPNLTNKTTLLKEDLAKIGKVEINNPDVTLQRNELICRIHGSLVIQTMRFFRSLKNIVKAYEEYVLEFPFPLRLALYNKKYREIACLYKRVDANIIPVGLVEAQAKEISNNINKVLTSLKEKAQSNERCIEALEKLDCLENEVDGVNPEDDLLELLKHYNVIRKEINSIDVVKKRIILRKAEICRQIQSNEDHIASHFEYPENIRLIKLNLNRHEIDAHFVYPSDDISEMNRKEILNFSKQVKYEIRLNNMPQEQGNELLKTITLVSDLYYRAVHRNNIVQNAIHSLKKFNEHFESFDQWDERSQHNFIESTMKSVYRVKNICETLPNEIADAQKMLEIGQRSIEFSKDIIPSVERLKLQIEQLPRPVHSKSFSVKLQKVLALKEKIDDISEVDDMLNLRKQSCLSELSSMVRLLDEHLAITLRAHTQNEVDMELKSHWNQFVPNNCEDYSNAGQFVEAVRKKAENLRDCVVCYFGNDSTTDYHALRDVLLNLWAKLDRYNRDSALLDKVSNIQKFIMDVIEKLAQNAS